jgi:RTA1 like protein
MNYVIFGRMLRSTLGLDHVCARYKLAFLPPAKVSAIFIGSDVISFLVQAGGSGLASSSKTSTVKLGLDVLLVGMALNLASFTLFISLVVYFDMATRRAYKSANMERPFLPVLRALYISWVFIMVRQLLTLLM